MLTKSYTTEQYVRSFAPNITIQVTGSYILNDNLRAFKEAKSAIEALTILQIQDMVPQIIQCPTVFNTEVKNLFTEYRDLTISQLLNKKFINCFDILIYIDPTNLKGGLSIKFVGDGVNRFDTANIDYIKGSPFLHFEISGMTSCDGINIQEILRSTLTGTDYKAFPDLKEVLLMSDKHPPKPSFYKLSMGGIKTDTLEKFQVRRTRWLEKNIEAFIIKNGSAVSHLLQVRSIVGLPHPKVGMKVFKGVKEVTGVAFYID